MKLLVKITQFDDLSILKSDKVVSKLEKLFRSPKYEELLDIK